METSSGLNKISFVDPREATADIPPAESEAIKCLNYVVLNGKDGFDQGPDLAINAFNDLDTVFFGGRLCGNGQVRWISSNKDFNGESDNSFGETGWNGPNCRGKCRIILDAESIFLEFYRPGCPSSFHLMLSTLLHEKFHAYEHVRSTDGYFEEERHDQHFGARINCVHDRAVAILDGVSALDAEEDFKQWHHLPSEETMRKRPIESLLKRIAGKTVEEGPFKHQIAGRRNFAAGVRIEKSDRGAGPQCAII